MLGLVNSTASVVSPVRALLESGLLIDLALAVTAVEWLALLGGVMCVVALSRANRGAVTFGCDVTARAALCVAGRGLSSDAGILLGIVAGVCVRSRAALARREEQAPSEQAAAPRHATDDPWLTICSTTTTLKCGPLDRCLHECAEMRSAEKCDLELEGFLRCSAAHPPVNENWPLIRFLLDDPVYRAKYRTALESVLRGSYEKTRFDARATELHDMILP